MNGPTYSTLRIKPDSIILETNQGFYSMPRDNNSGFLNSKGDGTTSWINGVNATYSTGDGRVVTVTDGLITNIS